MTVEIVNPLPTLCVEGDDKGERICTEHDYKWRADSRFCNAIYNEPWVLKLVDYIDALEAQRATGAGTLEDGVQFMGALMQQSATDLAFTTNAIIANHERTIEELRALVFDFMEAIDSAQVIDRKTEVRLDGPMTRAQIQWEMQARRGAST